MPLRLAPLVAATFLLAPGRLQGQEKPESVLDAYFDHIAKHDKAMGVVYITGDGKTYQKAFGMAVEGPEGKRTLRPDTRFRIGSLSKTYCAALILRLVEAGKLRLDQPIARFFPKLPGAKEITVEHLLRNRSGLFNITSDPTFTTWAGTLQTRATLLERIGSRPLAFPPGTAHAYCNSNFLLLAWIAEAVDGGSYARSLERRVLRPLNLRETYVMSGPIAPDKGECHSYAFKSGQGWVRQPETHHSIPVGAIVSTAEDVARFYDGLLSGRLLKGKTLAGMTRMVDEYGMGLAAFQVEGRAAWGHGGGMDGFQSLVLHFPAEKLTIAYLSNGWVYPRESLVSGALAGFRGQNLKLPDFSIRAVEIPLETLQTYVGVYVSDQLPVKMTVSIQEGRLQAQPSGQRAILLEATAPDAFRFEPMGITMAFDAAKGTLALRMRGKDFAFRREEVKNPPSP